jgi:hypothetical protein
MTYNSSKEIIDHSDILTDLPMQYLFSNLQTETTYYVEFQATSELGLIGTSGLVKFNVFYLRPKTNVNLTAMNIENGGIELSWYVKHIVGKVNGGSIGYINNDEITLSNGKTIYFDNGFNIDRDFSLKVWLRDVKSNVPLITLKGDNGSLVLKYNAVLQSFVITKITNVMNDLFKSNQNEISTTQYQFISPYQIVAVDGNKAIVLIQQVGSDINLSSSTYN